MINALDNEIEIILTNKCNWKCEYCCVDTHNLPNISSEDAINKIKKVQPDYNVTLSGGEIGLMKREPLKYILDYLKSINCIIRINTNGLFLKKYIEFAPYITHALYHCSENIDTAPDFESVEKWRTNGVDVEYMLVVTDNNIHKLTNYLNKYKSTQFHVVAATTPVGGLDVTLSNKNRYYIMKQQYKNMSKESLKRLIIKEKDFDGIKYL